MESSGDFQGVVKAVQTVAILTNKRLQLDIGLIGISQNRQREGAFFSLAAIFKETIFVLVSKPTKDASVVTPLDALPFPNKWLLGNPNGLEQGESKDAAIALLWRWFMTQAP